ncbi:MAG: type I restriction enzyme HsdR N-terminal domain-containing protein [Flavobacteriales bacterium]|nr:type I restriction enzyme HsdR N-terminal domain-containing protein [Flavobacteriales bacterium]
MSKSRIKCIVRNKWMVITPEELIRQRVLTYLIDKLEYPKGRFSVESVVEVNGMRKRADAIFHDEHGRPFMVIECKRADTKIDQRTISQIAMYNHSLDAPYLLLTNGDSTHILRIERSNNSIEALKSVPSYAEL